MKLERLRQDQQAFTAETLESLNFATQKHLKRLYNYQLAREREKAEIRDDSVQEYHWNNKSFEPFLEVIKRQQEKKLKYSGLKKMLRERKFEQIYFKQPRRGELDREEMQKNPPDIE